MFKKMLSQMSLIRKISISVGLILFIIAIIYLYNKGLFKYSSTIYHDDDFAIEKYQSANDEDSDRIDDQSDMFLSAKDYIEKEPKYEEKYYEKGYPDDNCGIASDVVAFAMLGAGYNIKQLMHDDIVKNKKEYDIKKININKDFRKVKNMNVYLKRNAKSVTKEIYVVSDWQTGDIIVFTDDIGILSDKRNKKGIPFVLHNGSKDQENYEEDIIEKRKDDIIGHYRIG